MRFSQNILRLYGNVRRMRENRLVKSVRVNLLVERLDDQVRGCLIFVTS